MHRIRRNQNVREKCNRIFQEQAHYIKSVGAFYPPQEIYEIFFKMIEELQQYRAIGTVEEYREAREILPNDNIFGEKYKQIRCPACGRITKCGKWDFDVGLEVGGKIHR